MEESRVHQVWWKLRYDKEEDKFILLFLEGNKKCMPGSVKLQLGEQEKSSKKIPKPRKQNYIPDSQHGSCIPDSVISNAQARHADLGDGAEQKPKFLVAQALR